MTTSSNDPESARWFVGKMERGQAEQFLMEVSSYGWLGNLRASTITPKFSRSVCVDEFEVSACSQVIIASRLYEDTLSRVWIAHATWSESYVHFYWWQTIQNKLQLPVGLPCSNCFHAKHNPWPLTVN